MNHPRNLALYSLLAVYVLSCETSSPTELFDGRTFSGWEGDTTKTWRIVNGEIVGGSLSEVVPHNEFLCTTESYSDFLLKLKFKLEGDEGFVNAGVQFRSRRIADPAYEVSGYQADIGHRLTGALYDESRRNTFLAGYDSLSAPRGIPGQWNDYEIRAVGNQIAIFVNGEETVNYYEQDPDIPQDGLIGLQIHGGGKALVSYKNITIEDLGGD